jgi:hypothetical protein
MMADMMDEAERCYARYEQHIRDRDFRGADHNAQVFAADYGHWLLARVRELEAGLAKQTEMNAALQQWLAACDRFDEAMSGSFDQHEYWMEACEAELNVKTLARHQPAAPCC